MRRFTLRPGMTNWKALNGDRISRRFVGFTLFEVLLVLTLVVVMSSLAAPMLQNSLATIRLRSSTDTVIAAWSEIRARAIETGHVYQFRFIEDSDQYRVERWYSENNIAQQDKLLDSPDELIEPSDELHQDDEDDWHYEESLSEGVKFNGGDQAVLDDENDRKVESLEADSSEDWSTPILFFPDGTTSDVSIVFSNDRGQYQRATLRSLTGVARASHLLSQSEVEGSNQR